jgi:hypothetical protein
VSFKTAFHALLDELNLGQEVKDRLHEEADVKDVPDTVPDDKPETEDE